MCPQFGEEKTKHRQEKKRRKKEIAKEEEEKKDGKNDASTHDSFHYHFPSSQLCCLREKKKKGEFATNFAHFSLLDHSSSKKGKVKVGREREFRITRKWTRNEVEKRTCNEHNCSSCVCLAFLKMCCEKKITVNSVCEESQGTFLSRPRRK